MDLQHIVSEAAKLGDDDLRAAVTQLTGLVQQRYDAPEPQSGASRDEVAAWLARQHLAMDPLIAEVFYLPSGSPDSEIRLIEINTFLPELPLEQIPALDFGLDIAGLDFTLLVADVTGKQWEEAQRGNLALPPGWSLEHCQRFMGSATK